MRSVAFSQYGSPDVLQPLQLPIPGVPNGHVRIRVVAAGVNPADWRIRSGQFRFALRVSLPFVPGTDVAGTVDAVGPGVDAPHVGDRVMGVLATKRGGGYAEFAVLPAEHVAVIPDACSLTDAAAVPLCGLTALQALRDEAGVQPGARVLVYGASGGVGTLAVQIGVALGATVEAVASARNRHTVAALGADRVTAYDTDDLSRLHGGFDVAFDAVNALSNTKLLALVRPGGTGVTVNPFRGRLAPDWLAWSRGGRRMRSLLVTERGADLSTLAGWLADGTLRPVVEQTYPLEEAALAHHRSETGRVRGKLVLLTG